RRHLDSTGSSDSGFEDFESNKNQKAKIVNVNAQSVYSSSLRTKNNDSTHQEYYPPRDSISSSSDDSAISVSSSKNNSYQSSTSPSSADISPCGSIISKQIQSNGLNVSQVSSKLMSQSNGKTGLNNNYPTSVSSSQSDNDSIPVTRLPSPRLSGSSVNSKRSSNLVNPPKNVLKQ